MVLYDLHTVNLPYYYLGGVVCGKKYQKFLYHWRMPENGWMVKIW